MDQRRGRHLTRRREDTGILTGSVGGVGPARCSERVRVLLVALGVFLTGALGALALVVYLLFGTSLHQHAAQERLRGDLRHAGGHPPGPGTPVALLRIPRLGSDYEQVVVQGTAPAQLALGPGHHPDSPWFGEPGNVAVAGHRTTHGAPFRDLDRLRAGDSLVVETTRGTFTYRVLRRLVVRPAGGSVLRADPTVSPPLLAASLPSDGSGTEQAPGHHLTLTTCHPRYSARRRLVLHAVQVSFGPAR